MRSRIDAGRGSPACRRIFSAVVDASELPAEFPVTAGLAYLNAGTDGPLPAAAAQAARAELDRELHDGRSKAHFERRTELTDALRAEYASLLGCDAHELALTTSTTEGIALTIDGLRLARGSEIV